MNGRYGLCRQSSGLWGSLRDGDFEEEDVWAILKERTADSSFKFCASTELPPPPSSSFSVSGPLLSAAKIIPRPSSNGRNNKQKNLQNSAPVNTPPWPQIYGQKSKISSWHDHDHDDDDKDDDDDDDGDEGEDEKLPPHEYIARRLARSHISSFSVLEGVGRTLKGRDLSKVRNAILTKTGFLEYPSK